MNIVERCCGGSKISKPVPLWWSDQLVLFSISYYLGTKEIDIAATLEYLRDQRPDMVKAKVIFFKLMSYFTVILIFY